MEKEKGILSLGGIKCDNPKCFYRDEDVKLEDYQNWVGKRCPKCGDVLLTEEDMNTVKLLAGSISIANKIDEKTEEKETDG